VDDINEPTPCTLLYVKGRTLRIIEVTDAIVVTTHIMHGRPIPSECTVFKVTTIREGCEFEDLVYPDEEEEIDKLKDAKGNFILWPREDIILKICSSLIFLPQNKEDEGTRTSQNTLCNIDGFTPPSQNTPQTTPPPKNPPPTQPLEHHSPPCVAVSNSPPHTNPPLQNPPPTQLIEHHSLLCQSPPHTITPQIPLAEQALQHRSPPRVAFSMSPPHTTPPL
jgi:hypothetical protein